MSPRVLPWLYTPDRSWAHLWSVLLVSRQVMHGEIGKMIHCRYFRRTRLTVMLNVLSPSAAGLLSPPRPPQHQPLVVRLRIEARPLRVRPELRALPNDLREATPDVRPEVAGAGTPQAPYLARPSLTREVAAFPRTWLEQTWRGAAAPAGAAPGGRRRARPLRRSCSRRS